MVDKDYCMSSYLAFRFIERDDADFFEGLHHKKTFLYPNDSKIAIQSAQDIDNAIKEILSKYQGEKLGLLLSGGMDSANYAAYMPGCDAYTFRFIGGNYDDIELQRAEYYANRYNMKLHYIDISWDTITSCLDIVMTNKACPVATIEPQIYLAAEQAKEDGIEMMVTGEGGDTTFGGMSKILSKDWKFDDFEEWYTFIDPSLVLNNPVDVSYVYECYRHGEYIDFEGFLKGVYAVESGSSFQNAFQAADMPFLTPYLMMKMAEPLDLNRIRNGESKYLVRELFSMNYPEIPVPDKVPMPRPVDIYFQEWEGPVRAEFKDNIDMTHFTGNQKWQLYCLERFLNLFDKQ